MTPSELDDALALSQADTAGRWAGSFTSSWMIGNAVNGGLVMALAATALRGELGGPDGHEDPIALSAFFLSPSGPGPVIVETATLRSGRTLSTGQVSVSQPAPSGPLVERMRALASYGDLDDSMEVLREASPPPMPPPEQCLSAEQAPPEFLAHFSLLDRVDLRIDPATAGWAMGRPSRRGELRGWLRLRDGREPDPVMLLFALDAMPPVAFDLGLLGWTPTLEFTGHIRARPAAGWLRVALTTDNLSGGFLEEDAMIWDCTDRLVAQSRQLCGVRMSDARG